MDKNLISAPSLHIHSDITSRRLMADVVIALLPACFAACVIFGTKALSVLLVCTVSAVVAEAVFNLVTDQPQSIGDLSAVVTGILLGLNLSTNVALWQCAVGSAFAVVVAKKLFGGMGKTLQILLLPAEYLCCLPSLLLQAARNQLSEQLLMQSVLQHRWNSSLREIQRHSRQ